jgi:hypothetical protein
VSRKLRERQRLHLARMQQQMDGLGDRDQVQAARVARPPAEAHLRAARPPPTNHATSSLSFWGKSQVVRLGSRTADPETFRHGARSQNLRAARGLAEQRRPERREKQEDPSAGPGRIRCIRTLARRSQSFAHMSRRRGAG